MTSEQWNENGRKRRRQGRKRKRRPYAQPDPELTDEQWRDEQESIAIENDDNRSTQGWNRQRDNEQDRPLRRLPQKVEKIREPFAALERERQLSEKRERIRQRDREIDGFDKSYRKPYAAAKKEEEEMDEGSPNSDIKSILKQAGGLSLSEILQQRNLSLADLLRGKQVALAAISQTSLPITEIYDEPQTTRRMEEIDDFPQKRRLPSLQNNKPDNEEIKENKGPRRIPNFNSRKRLDEVTTIQNEEINDQPEIDETNRVLPTIPNIRDHSRQPVAPRPIKEVVPGIRPDLNNSNTKTRIPNFRQKIEISTESTSTTRPLRYRENKENENKGRLPFKTKQTTVVPMLETTVETLLLTSESGTTDSSFKLLESTPKPYNFRNRGITRPRLRLPVKSEKPIQIIENSSGETENYPKMPIEKFRKVEPISQEEIEEKIKKSEPTANAIEKFTSFEDAKPKNVATIEELFDAGETFQEMIRHSTQRSFDEMDVTESNPSLFSDVTSVKTVDDRTDLLELMEDRRNGARLAKVLAQRNMSLDELIEHRQRGSSQLHLAEIFNSNKPKLKIFLDPLPEDKLDIVTAFENFPSFNLGDIKSVKPDEIKTDSQGSSYFTSIIHIKPTDEAFKEGRSMHDEDDEILKPPPIPTYNDKQSHTQWDVPIFPTKTFEGDFNNDRSVDGSGIFADQIENELSRANDILDLELSGHGFKKNSVIIESTSIPVGVRSAIIASSCIVIISVVVFVIIFAACRWRIKRKTKLHYTTEEYTAKSRLPFMERDASKRSTSPPIVFPGPRCGASIPGSKLNTMDPNSPEVQDYLYDAMRRPYQ